MATVVDQNGRQIRQIEDLPQNQVALSANDLQQNDLNRGTEWARNQLYNDQDIQDVQRRLSDLSQGYSGATLGRLRSAANAKIEGARQGYLGQLQGRLARAGVGGARGAVMRSGADKQSLDQVMQNENALAAQDAAMVNQGTQNLNDFLMKRKFGVLSSGLATAGFGAQERAGVRASNAAMHDNSSGPFGLKW